MGVPTSPSSSGSANAFETHSLVQAISAANICAYVLQLDLVWTSKPGQAGNISTDELWELHRLGSHMAGQIDELRGYIGFLESDFPKKAQAAADAGFFGSNEANQEVSQAASQLASSAAHLSDDAAHELQNLSAKLKQLEEAALGKATDLPPPDLGPAFKRRALSIVGALATITVRSFLMDVDVFQVDGLFDFLKDWSPLSSPLISELKALRNRRRQKGEQPQAQVADATSAAGQKTDETAGQAPPRSDQPPPL